MIYNDFQGLKLSALGYGNMRLPTLESGGIDLTEADKLIAYAYENGVNYFDTAYGYHGGESESFIGKSLSRFPRDTWYLASKFPGYQKRATWNPAEVFAKQLSRCGVEYFDFYLLHNVYESSFKTYTNPKFGIIDYLLEERRRGRIKRLGFSSHGGVPLLKEFLELYGSQMEFGMIEMNALDWNLRNILEKYDLIGSFGIPLWVMEPVRGGRLASLPPESEAKLKSLRPTESVAAWAFRWLETFPKVTVVLSGMSKMAEVEDNLRTFAARKPLNETEKRVYEAVIGSLARIIECSGCRYCVQNCPKGLDIPTLIFLYNDCRFEPSTVAKMAVDAMKPSKRPNVCVKCGNCVEVCPQIIDIPSALKKFAAILETMPSFVPPAQEDD
ncbi:MAG: aldo/keto reductase [Deltaproteobacteria bacterium]|jgi:predicted aldo/keto reductase-like oxidoreductase|nr:aldo/keto reductase [Deltaproteobacteria bacterium]